MRPTSTRRDHSHRPRRRDHRAAWRVSSPPDHHGKTSAPRRSALIVCLLMASGYGRGLRMVAGAFVVTLGLAVIGGPLGNVIAAIGGLAIFEAQYDVFFAGKLFGCPIDGPAVRRASRLAC